MTASRVPNPPPLDSGTVPSSAGAPSRVLLIRPSALGDVCRSVPLLVSMRAAWPDAKIDWLVNAGFAGAVSAHPALSATVPFERKVLGRWWTPSGFAHLRTFLARLRSAKYDLVVDAQGLARSALFTRLTGASIRVGPSDARECGTLAYSIAATVSQPHTVDRMMELLAPLEVKPVLDLRLYAPADALAKLAGDPVLQGKRFAVLAPTSRWPGKRWPADRFASLALELRRRHAADLDAVVIVGATSERDQCGPLLALSSADTGVIDRIGSTSVGDLMALVARASLVVANDSAVIHMATGFGRPMVALYGPTDVAKVGPYRAGGDVIQHREPADMLNHKDEVAGLAMMQRITVDEVLAKVAERLRTER